MSVLSQLCLRTSSLYFELATAFAIAHFSGANRTTVVDLAYALKIPGLKCAKLGTFSASLCLTGMSDHARSRRSLQLARNMLQIRSVITSRLLSLLFRVFILHLLLPIRPLV